MAGAIHFVQRCDGPVFVGPGADALRCAACAAVLIEGYDAGRFRAVTIECGACGAANTTPPLPDGAPPPTAVIVAEPTAEARPATTVLPANVYVIGRAEMDRISALWQPVNPEGNRYRVTPALLDDVEARHDRWVGDGLPAVRPTPNRLDPLRAFEGMREHALGWAVAHLRERMTDPAWSCTDTHATSAACVLACGFLHFTATWAHHPLFPAMVGAAAAARGFSLHGLAPFAAAHFLTMMGNRVGFPPSGTSLGGGFSLAVGPADLVAARVDAFDRFEHPFGRPWNPSALRTAVTERIGAEQGRINLKNPGLLLLSPGVCVDGFDEALVSALRAAMPGAGRRNRGLMAAGPIVLRMQAQPDPHALRFGYGLFPVSNKHYEGGVALQAAGGGTAVVA